MTSTCTNCGVEKPITAFHKRQNKHGHTSRCKDCRNEQDRNRYHDRGAPREPNRGHHYLYRYGITVEDYDAMFEEQKGCCAICRTHSDKFTRRLAVDHCHTTGTVRGLLCVNCNVGLGNFKDDIENLYRSISYLQGHE